MTQAVEYRYRLDENELDEVEVDIERGPGVATRLERVWKLVEFIATNPGKRRKELALEFSVSERQTQADLNLIKRQMRLPLIRRSGYRFGHFRDEPQAELNLADIQLLILLLRRGRYDRAIPGERLQALEAALPSLAPLHLRPLVAAAMAAATETEGGGRRSELFGVITEAMVSGRSIRLHYPMDSPVHDHAPVLKPEVVFPFNGQWYVLGECRGRQRVMVFPLQQAVSVSPFF